MELESSFYVDRLSFGFGNPNHAAALACALLPLCWGWRRTAWIGRTLSVALFAAGALPADVGAEADDARCRALLQRTFDFDYLGVGHSGGNAGQALDVHHLVVRSLEGSCAVRECFQRLLEEWERAFLRGDLDGCRDKVAEMARIIDSIVGGGQSDRRVALRLIRQYEYSIVRMLFHETCRPEGRLRFLKWALEAVVPDRLPEHGWDGKAFRRVGIFREMVILGMEIERMREADGALPRTLQDISGSAKETGIEYSTDGNTWQLFSPVTVRHGDFAPLDAYVPLIEYDPQVPRSACLWLSPDFARKRRDLYQGKVINEGRKGWECAMKGGKLDMVR